MFKKKMTAIEMLQGKTTNKPKKIDFIVLGVLFYWVVFVIVAWVTFWVKDSIPDTLVQVGLSGGAVELEVTGAIEILRDKRRKREDGDVG